MTTTFTINPNLCTLCGKAEPKIGCLCYKCSKSRQPAKSFHSDDGMDVFGPFPATVSDAELVAAMLCCEGGDPEYVKAGYVVDLAHANGPSAKGSKRSVKSILTAE